MTSSTPSIFVAQYAHNRRNSNSTKADTKNIQPKYIVLGYGFVRSLNISLLGASQFRASINSVLYLQVSIVPLKTNYIFHRLPFL